MTDGMIGNSHESSEIPTVHGALVGFRRWSLRGDRLGAPHKMGFYWTPGVNTATCDVGAHPHDKKFQTQELLGGLVNALLGGHVLLAGERREAQPIPHKNCHCGLYSYHRPDVMAPLSSQPSLFGEVSGAVLMWGRIEVHETGFRAEKAMPILLARTGPARNIRSLLEKARFDSYDQQLQSVAARYSMQIVEENELFDKASELGKIYTPDIFDNAS